MRTFARVALATTVPLVALVAGFPACGGDTPSGPVPTLIKPSAERIERLYAAREDAAAVTPVTPVASGKAGFADAAQISAFVQECGERPTIEPPTDDSELTGTYGLLYEGTRAPDLRPMAPGNVFRTVEGNPEYLDPNLIGESAGTAIGMQMFETLLVPAPGNTAPRPGAAESYDVSEDGRVYTFHIREGMTWSDGRPLNAHDFRYSWLRGLTPETGSRNAQTLWKIKGAQAFNEGKTRDPATVGIRVPDDHTLEVELEVPAAYFPDLVTYIAYAPVPRHIVESAGDQWTRPENIVVNGPFKMKAWEQRSRIVLEKNPRYWDADNVALDGVFFYNSDSEQTNVNLYETGQIHWARPLPNNRVKEWLKDGRSDLKVAEMMCTYYYVYRTDRPPFEDPQVRRAFNMAVDKQKMTDSVVGGFVKPATNLIPDMFRGTLGYVPASGDPYDVSQARQLLAVAGYPNAAGLPPVEIVYNTFEGHKLIAEYISQSIESTLGAKVTSTNMEWKSLLKKAHAGDFTISRTSWCADYPDPISYLEVFHSKSENNYPAYTNPAYDALLDRIGSETDRDERNNLICAAEKTLNRDLPIMPLYFYARSYLLRPEVQGLLPQYQDHHYMKWVSLPASGGR